MFYTALVDLKNKKLHYAEEHKKHEEAVRRANSLSIQADLNIAGMCKDHEKHDQWGTYLGDTPFEWPKELETTEPPQVEKKPKEKK